MNRNNPGTYAEYRKAREPYENRSRTRAVPHWYGPRPISEDDAIKKYYNELKTGIAYNSLTDGAGEEKPQIKELIRLAINNPDKGDRLFKKILVEALDSGYHRMYTPEKSMEKIQQEMSELKGMERTERRARATERSIKADPYDMSSRLPQIQHYIRRITPSPLEHVQYSTAISELEEGLNAEASQRQFDYQQQLRTYQGTLLETRPTVLGITNLDDIITQAARDVKYYYDNRLSKHFRLPKENITQLRRLAAAMAALYDLSSTNRKYEYARSQRGLALYERIKSGLEDELAIFIINNPAFDNTGDETRDQLVRRLTTDVFPTIEQLKAVLPSDADRAAAAASAAAHQSRISKLATFRPPGSGGRRRTHKRHPKKRHNKRKTQRK